MARRSGGRHTLAATAALSLLLTACTNQQDNPAGSQSGANSAVLGHVHGVGVDPADGTVYVAAHSGLYRATQGRFEPIGDLQRDLMGFTIAGPGTFLSSGHPGPWERTPDPLGLVESRDAGTTWTTLALSGQSDFHTLDVAGPTVYGYDGALRASTDGGRTWDTRAGIAAVDIAVNPREPTTLVASTQTGVALSRDGGRSFGPPAGPVLLFLAWAPQGSAYGLAPDGGLYTSPDGATWTKVGTVPGGRPQALGTGHDGRVLAATAGGIYSSTDSGVTFTKLA